MTARSHTKLTDLTFGDTVSRTSLNLADDLSPLQEREVEKLLELLKDRPLVAVAKLSQSELYNQLKGELVDTLGMATGGLLRTVRQINLAANRQLSVKRLQLVNRTTGSDYQLEELADMSLYDLLQLVIRCPLVALYVEDIIEQRVKRVKSTAWVVPTANTEAKSGVPRIHLDATLRHVGRYDGLAEVKDLPLRDGVPTTPISFRDAFVTCDVF